MPRNIRQLSIEDHDHIKLLCETIWNGNDYVPAIFPKWIEDPLARNLGLFESEELVAFGIIEKIADADIAWVQGLRVKEGHREKGHATTVTSALIDVAKELKIKHLWYATSSRNAASMKVAVNCGFHEADRTGYFRIYKPFPAHPRPSLSIVPLSVTPERLYELLLANPDVVESSTFPLAWHFDFKTKEGLTRLLQDSIVKVVVDFKKPQSPQIAPVSGGEGISTAIDQGESVRTAEIHNPADCRQEVQSLPLGRAVANDMQGGGLLCRLSRYETAIERSMFKNLRQLQTLQRQPAANYNSEPPDI